MGIIIDENGATIDTQVANFERMKNEILNEIDGNLSFVPRNEWKLLAQSKKISFIKR